MKLKHLSALFALSISLASCSESDGLVDALDKDNAIPQSEIRSIDEAYEIAAQSLTWFDSADSRSSVRLLPAKNEIKVLKSKESRGESSDTLMYVVNFQDEEGFAIIPANRNLPEILAVTESGSYDPASDSEVEPFNEYMKNAISVMAKGSHELLPVDTLREYFMEQKIVYKDTTIEVKPRANLYWGQNGVEGMYCPNKVCGCAPLAIALCLSYFEKPMTFDYFDNGVHSYTYLDWAQIKKHNARNDYFNKLGFIKCYENVDTTAQQNLGKLCRQIGIYANSTYSLEKKATGTSTNGIIKSLQLFGFKVSKPENYFSSCCEHQLSRGGIILVMAESSEETSSGHAWVLDGYRYQRVEEWKYKRINDSNKISPDLEPKPGDWELTSHIVSVNEFVHFNWGWKGECNGYFWNTSWKTANAASYDDYSFRNSYSIDYDKDKQYFYLTL